MLDSKRILIVDDDPDHLLICKLVFERRGYLVMPLMGCEEMDHLINAVKIFKPDLIFIDHNMPGICGTDATKMLKSHPEYSLIPVIYFSGQDNIVQLAKEAGANAFFRKPFEINALLGIVKKFVA